MADIGPRTTHPHDIFNQDGPMVALVQIEGRATISPDVVFQAVIDPALISPSRQFIHFDQRTQRTDLHGWFDLDSLRIIEVLCRCDASGVPVEGQSVYVKRGPDVAEKRVA